jgi:pimeloyl-ACP methyl ester carboxylesterase
VFDRLINAAGMRFRAMGLPPWPLADILLYWGGRQWGFDAFSHNPSDYARSVKCPTLLIFGESDARVELHQAAAIHQNLAGRKNLVIVPGMRHQTAIAAAPETWRKEVSAFLAVY